MAMFSKSYGMLAGASPWQVNNVKSLRTDTYDEDTGEFNTVIGDELGDNEVGHTYLVDSTAIQSARYDPSDDSLNIVYKGGGKEYKFSATPKQAKQWLESPSKGRTTHEWQFTNRYPGY